MCVGYGCRELLELATSALASVGPKPMTLSVERICNELNRKGLLPPQEIRDLR